MNKYFIKKTLDDDFIIVGENLYYSQNDTMFNGCQCGNVKNINKIREKCMQIINLMSDIENLNNINH